MQTRRQQSCQSAGLLQPGLSFRGRLGLSAGRKTRARCPRDVVALKLPCPGTYVIFGSCFGFNVANNPEIWGCGTIKRGLSPGRPGESRSCGPAAPGASCAPLQVSTVGLAQYSRSEPGAASTPTFRAHQRHSHDFNTIGDRVYQKLARDAPFTAHKGLLKPRSPSGATRATRPPPRFAVAAERAAPPLRHP